MARLEMAGYRTRFTVSATDTVEAAEYLTELGCFEKVDYDYIMGVTADVSSVDVSSNPYADGQSNLGVHNVQETWDYLAEQGKNPGGSPDVIVAVIDTGVDYTHLDLRNNIWVNPAEIPDNGIDDDGNGYVDDIYGWDCVGNDNDPMDDNGHGTHVAGIVAAENNDIGGVGIAFNCKIMVLKAGNSSGYFNNSDIAEAIQYAYMNGASVINMSFGGSSVSIAVEEALENAYNSCVLVASAGNSEECNNLACETCDNVNSHYPSSFPYVIGVMSTDSSGKVISSFSNYDHNPYNSVEHEVYAVGEFVFSTWPGNRYTSCSGTSMAAPTVAGIAALLRSTYSDREVYPTKFIQSQIINTGTIHPKNTTLDEEDLAHSVTDALRAMTQLPKPAVNLYDYYIDDSSSISAVNNGNGVVDAGETIRLHISLHNRGGVASNVNVSIDTDESGMGITDPYFTFVNSTMQLSDIGTYSERESGDKYFEIIVSPDCPNDYHANFHIRYTYKNGLDDEDTTLYRDDGKQIADLRVYTGEVLPSVIDEDTVFKGNKIYYVASDVYIAEGVNVTFEAGATIQYYQNTAGYFDTLYNSPQIVNYGALTFNGSPNNRITISPSESFSNYACIILSRGSVNFNYTDVYNLSNHSVDDKNANSNITADHSSFSYYAGKSTFLGIYKAGVVSATQAQVTFKSMTNSSMDVSNARIIVNCTSVDKCVFVNGTIESYNSLIYISSMSNTIFYSKNAASTRFNDAPIIRIYDTAINNVFMQVSNSRLARDYVGIALSSDGQYVSNKFYGMYYTHAQMLLQNYMQSNGTPLFDLDDVSQQDLSLLYPFVTDISFTNADGNPITTVGREEINVRVTFNRPMDATQNTFLTFGTIEPYADYRINGEWVSDTVWEGSYTLKAQIENGQNFLKVNNACAADDPTKVVYGEYQLYEFTIDTTEAMSMNLQAIAKPNGIELTFAQDDYDTLLGYNIYRSTSKDGKYVKLNPAILLPSDSTFLDENAEPGKTYWYTYTVVLTDFSESNPAGKVVATAMDTLAPNMYHTPVNQGYMNNNLVISCTASDNVAISTVTLYYRTVGATEWKTLNMAKQSDKYSATIFGSDLTLDGIEYYIVASDGRNTINKGSAEVPYTVIVKDASAISRKGDVDGDGVVTAKDALMLMKCLEGKLILSDDEFQRADLNDDGSLSAAEALRILQYVNGKVNTLEM